MLDIDPSTTRLMYVGSASGESPMKYALYSASVMLAPEKSSCVNAFSPSFTVTVRLPISTSQSKYTLADKRRQENLDALKRASSTVASTGNIYERELETLEERFRGSDDLFTGSASHLEPYVVQFVLTLMPYKLIA